ncbi:MAG TPA: putative toxin-antitoxin system toxin component, PIN family, partial [Porphyromonadaceae bacterium]|nr:putative toxin-antitoxin system toxin component, PIN family [Porphyromonadaceae bacterium]
ASAINHAIERGQIALLPQTLIEFVFVIFRKKFDRYFEGYRQRLELIETIRKNIVFVTPVEQIVACRDPKDNMLLELAVAAKALCIVTGDHDLQILDPFGNIRIVSPTEFIELF